jgi:hypothetical protein
MSDGERKARILQCRQWRVQLNSVHGDCWEVAQLSRTPNVASLARSVTRLAIIMREMVDELQRDAGLPVPSREAVLREDAYDVAQERLFRAARRDGAG